MSSHSKAAAKFIADAPRTAWHDKALFAVRTKRDKMMHEVPEWEALREASSQIKRHTLSHLAHYLEEFERNATANGIVVHWAADADEMNRTVWELISAHGGKNLIKSKSMLSEECGLTPYLLQRGVDAVESDLGERIMQLLHEPPSHIVLPAIAVRREEVGALFEKVWHTEPGNSDPTYLTHQARIHLRSKFLGADIAMTGVNFAVAEAGAFAVCTNEGNADLGTSFPDLHIAIMGLEKVIPDYRALAVFTRLLARSATGQPVTAYTSLYRRPAPGKQIHVIIVDNGRTESLANAAHRNMLKCLRCGACMNTCPVYRRSGGYSYSYFIPGPLGINLGMLRSPERYGGNVSGCSLCYSCSDVCPAKIDLGEQIYAWRQEMGEKNLIDWHKKFMVKGMDFAMGGPGRFYAAVGAARIAEYLPRFVLNNKLNPWYAYGRDIPHFARSTFTPGGKRAKSNPKNRPNDEQQRNNTEPHRRSRHASGRLPRFRLHSAAVRRSHGRLRRSRESGRRAGRRGRREPPYRVDPPILSRRQNHRLRPARSTRHYQPRHGGRRPEADRYRPGRNRRLFRRGGKRRGMDPAGYPPQSLYFGATALMILIPRDALVDTMHEALARPELDDFEYGCFMSGPSKPQISNRPWSSGRTVRCRSPSYCGKPHLSTPRPLSGTFPKCRIVRCTIRPYHP